MTAAQKFPLKGSAVAKDTAKEQVILGEDWVSPDVVSDALRNGRSKRSLFSLNKSPLARKIIAFNLLALLILVAGVLFLNPFRDSLVVQREAGLVSEARLVADVIRAGAENSGTLPSDISDITITSGVEVYLLSPAGLVLAQTVGTSTNPAATPAQSSTIITDFLDRIWNLAAGVFITPRPAQPANGAALAREVFAQALLGQTAVKTAQGQNGASFSVATPVLRDGRILAVVALTSPAGEIDRLLRNEREQVLRMFLIALLVSIGLSMVLASTIANPLSDLAAAAEMGRDRHANKMQAGRVRIPDLTARPDEIGRLSVAMRGMVGALYDRIDANEQFAADVAHEIKNPLASLRSAVGTMRLAKRDDQRERLLEVIEHDVRRMDRLVTDISNASRLDSELVKEQESAVNLTQTLTRLCDYLATQAHEKGVEFITDFPAEPAFVRGLEERLAQVFVNLISNAISFCEDGDAVRVWARQRENRLLIVVEDTGPGIPEQALTKVFKRFYSDRPPTHFGNNSGLGLSISKQIVEAHGGVIWAENIRPTKADLASEPLGARFVVGLPI
ncbi:MAG: sensor N-terminal transmembrane domain-containing protein [Cypionkella sp.]